MKAVKLNLHGIKIQKPITAQYRTVNRIVSHDHAQQKSKQNSLVYNKYNSGRNNYRYYSSWSKSASDFTPLGSKSAVNGGSLLGFGFILGGMAFLTALAQSEEEEHKKIVESAGSRQKGLPEYSRDEVSKHNTPETGIWVTYKHGVYDVTEFVEMHPGGDSKILMAAGGSIDPFWRVYGQHMEPNVVEILESLRIGNLREADVLLNMQELSKDPYGNEPSNRDPHLIVRSQKPFNAETPPELLAERLITPIEHFYIRNHLPVPAIDPNNYTVEITGDGIKPIRLTLQQLKTLFPKKSVVTTIQCAGNRRNEMTKIKPVRGGSWDIGAISTAEWTGVSLRDVLLHAGLDPEKAGTKHIHFHGLDKDFEKSYGASIPVDKAMSPSGDVILAFQMNGQDIPLDHGYPVRAIVPGVVGARNVKWLSKVHASKHESQNHWQQLDYKGFSPSIDWHNVDFNKAPAIQDLPVVSAIALPKDGTVLPDDTKEVTVKGYAWSGGGRGIVRVDVSVDGGKNWHIADLEQVPQPEGRQWAWSLWKLKVPVPADSDGKLEIVCKAVDTSYNNQPERVEPIWNLRGVLNNSWHRVNVVVPVNKTDK